MRSKSCALLLFTCAIVIALTIPDRVGATSQWTRKTGLSCNTCHSVFPRLNPFGEEFLRNGYQLKTHKERQEEETTKLVDELGNLLGFRVNVTPIMYETNSLQVGFDSVAKKPEMAGRWTFGQPNWIQFFAAGSIQKDISFFSELEYAPSGFKFNWFYFNFTNLFGTKLANLQVGNISPMEFASYPNRLPQLPALKSEAMLIKASDGKGEESVDMSSARPGIQYYGRTDWALLYAGLSPGTSGRDINEFPQYWGGLVFQIPEDAVEGFDGTNLTVHYYAGTDTKLTGRQGGALENQFTRLSPQLNVRYDEALDLQFAYIIGEEKNRFFKEPTTGDIPVWKFTGYGLEAGYMPTEDIQLAVHYDYYKYEDDTKQFHRIVPAFTYVLNQNIRGTVYYEQDLGPGQNKVAKIYLNMRTMF
jgi:hypothetical protein